MSEDEKLLGYLRKVTADLHQTRNRLRELENQTAEPIAIVAMSCRYPGEVATPEQLWDLVAAGGDAVGPFPTDRGWDLDTLFRDGQPGSSYVREGGFLRGAAEFDPGFFGIAPREALAMDPQQRLVLEVAWEAFERAGIDPDVMRGERVGVFVGSGAQDYSALVDAAPEVGEAYLGTATSAAVISGRVSYVLGLEGPTATVDTACSSSMVAVHLAVQALRRKECGLALAGGVMLMTTPVVFVGMSKQGGLAPDGRCKPFSDSADGTGWAEGAGLLLLERLSDARRNGHRVLAVVRGSAMNSDGASNGLTAPNGPSQQRVIRAALADAGLSAGEIDAVEAHGTGTTLGDPIEAQALLATYGRSHSAEQPLWLGSLKSNIGHAQGAAGVGGLIKMVMAMRHETLPRTLHVTEPSTHVDWTAGHVRLLTEDRPWPAAADRPRRAGVSAFGISGTNVHVILEQADAAQVAVADVEPESIGAAVVPWVVSGRSAEALRGQASRLLERLEGEPELDAWEVGYALAVTRSRFEQRAVVLGADRAALTAGLTALADGREDASVVTGRASGVRRPVFVFPGQGSQWVRMGVELIEASPVFAARMAECAEALSEFVEWDLFEVLSDETALSRVDVVQPVLWAMMVSLAEMWRANGVKPEAVVGHSQGEIAAAVVAGVLSLQDGARVVALRSALIAVELAGQGGMMSVPLAASEAAVRIERWDGRLCLAAVNGPGSVVVCGDDGALDELHAELIAEGLSPKKIPVDYASHSHYVEAIEEQVLTQLAPVQARSGEIALYSAVTGDVLDTREMGARYWYTNLRTTVRFEEATRALLRDGFDLWVECSPHPVLRVPVEATLEDAGVDAPVLGSLRRHEGGLTDFLTSLARAHVRGATVDWTAGRPVPAPIDLPTYAFTRQRYWVDANPVADVAAAGLDAADHPLLGAVVQLPDSGELVFTGRLSTGAQPWLNDHRVNGAVVLPGTAYVELAIRAGDQLGYAVLEDLTLHTPLILSDAEAARRGVRLQVVVGAPTADAARPVAIYSRDPELPADVPWTKHADGLLNTGAPAPETFPESWPPAGAERVELGELYAELAAAGLEYGPAFQGLRAVWRAGGEVFAEVELGTAPAGFGIHPALLDACLHAAAFSGLFDEQAVLPFAWSQVGLHATGATQVRVRLSPVGAGSVTLSIADPAGQPVLSAESLALRPVSEELRASRQQPGGDSLYRVDWVPVPAGSATDTDFVVLQVNPGITAESVHAAAAHALSELHARLADEESTATLVAVTRGAIARPGADVTDFAGAAVWGLLRSAQSEHPGRIVVVDTDDSVDLATVVDTGEPQVMVRGGVVHAARLARVQVTGPAVEFAADGDVLITGGTGALGRLFARHLVVRYGVRRLVLTSRRGPDAPGATALVDELAELGAQARVVACDTADRDQLTALLAELDLTAVVHLAGVLDDGLVTDLTGERLRKVLRPKVDAALLLHELTRDRELSAFVLFSSSAGVLGSPGQANYAAANAFLDALATHRAAHGLTAQSLAWGLWAEVESTDLAGLAGTLRTADVARIAGNGLRALTAETGLAAFDAALATSEPALTPMALDFPVLRAQADQLPHLFRGLLPAVRRRSAGSRAADGGLADRLAALPEAERQTLVLAMVLERVARVLGFGSGESIEPDRAFNELGFDSLSAVEFRNGLSGETGLRLPASLVFDYPTPVLLADHVTRQLAGTGRAIEVRRAVAGADEPIAIVGMACRYPGGVSSPEELWQLVADEVDAISEFPADRGWDLDALFDPTGARPATSYVNTGGFLYDADTFDAAFFGIAPNEALIMDPQQRLLLETTWEAFERAGIDPASLRGSRTGVFAGMMYHDYAASASTGAIASGRISYVFGLEGPAVTVDTACSSSLVALHLAGQALRSGECTLALAGGVAVMATPEGFVEFSRQRGLSPDGRARSFAGAADGTAWAEGCGVLVLERLSDARRNGHPVLAVVRGSAVNQDGASNGLTAPNGPSQERVIRQALANAGLSTAEVDIVEAHGTGTTLGDPIEAQAVLATYGQDRPAGQPLWLGSLKSNFGHAQAAAGVAGVIKMVMALRHDVMPRTLHVDEPTPHVDWSAGEVRLLTEAREWPVNGHPRRAGVSSFGISGTNTHVIIEEAPAQPPTVPDRGAEPPVTMWALSAKSDAALADQARRLLARVAADPECRTADIGLSLVRSRAVFERRAVIVGADRDALIDGLEALADERTAANVVRGTARGTGRLGFLFTGQGSQRLGMGRELYQGYPAFAAAFDTVVAELDSHLERSLREIVWGEDEDLLNRTDFAQPALFAVEVALYRLLETWGVRADFVTGHSIGEFAAAHVSGVLTLSDAARLVCARGRLMYALPTGGAMVAIQATEDEVAPLLTESVSIAAVNAPGSIVVSGAEDAVLAVAESFAALGRKTNRLRVSHAFHSPLMEPMLAEFAEIAREISFAAPSIPMVSTVTGVLADEQILTPEYWVNQVRATVRFADAVQALTDAGVTTCLELGPDAVLTGMAADRSESVAFTATLRRDRAEAAQLATALGTCHARGHRVDWAAWFAGAAIVDLPTYAFQGERFWLDSLDYWRQAWAGASTGLGDVSAAGLETAGHPLLGAVIAAPDTDSVVLTGRLSARTQAWLADHRVLGDIVFPGAGFVELAIRAGDQVGGAMLDELILREPLVLPESGGVAIRVSVTASDESGRRTVAVHARGDDPTLPWVCHAAGVLRDAASAPEESLLDWPPAGATALDLDRTYSDLAEIGLDYGPVFRGLRAAWRRDGEVFAEVALPDAIRDDAAEYGLHPALLDACLHAIGLTDVVDDAVALPFSWSQVALHAAGAAATRVRVTPLGAGTVRLTIADADGAPVATVEALTLREISADQLAASRTEPLYELTWTPIGAVTDTASDAEPVVLQTVSGIDPASVRAATEQALAALHQWTDTDTTYVIRTSGAVALPGETLTDLAGAAVWGLGRTAQSEYDARIVLVDTDGSIPLAEVLTGGEPQLVVREGVRYAARLTPLPQEAQLPEQDAPTGFGDGAVLLTGGTGGLGALLARHLVTRHEVRRLILTSRTGIDAPGAQALRAELTDLGAHVDIAACDVADRAAVAELLAAHEISAIVHLAGVLDDGTIDALTPQRLDRVFRPKVDAAWHLHELTRTLDLSAFVLFSSAAGIFGTPGQGNYAAANAYLDALAQYRHANGLVAQSLPWGLWDTADGMGAGLTDAERQRINRGGIPALTAEQALERFDAARATTAVVPVPVRLDTAVLAHATAVPAVLNHLVRRIRRRSATTGSASAGQFARQLAALPAADRLAVVLQLVRTQAATVLGHNGIDAIEPDRSFGDLGFDSLSAVDFRTALAADIGIRLPASLIFDYPTPIVLSEFLVATATGAAETSAAPIRATAALDEPIAIVGMACRYPGGVSSPEELWQLVADGVDAISEFPVDRGWDLDSVFDPTGQRPQSSYVNTGGFLHNAAQFDPGFFGISPNEALVMDPQQRLLLESTWEALERAGIDPSSLRGSRTGVFAGMMYHDYEANANTGSIASGRISYVFGLEGPAMTVDTACSSSLVALHLAQQALRSGECSLALVSGVAVMASPDAFVEFSRQRGLSADGRCRSFAGSADGTAWAEGCGVLVVERLSDARRNGHPVLAVVAGSAVNQDGASNGLTAPNGPSQERVIRQALANAGLSGAEVDVIEGHGTGTTLGDPIEAQALLATYGQDRPEGQPLWLGSLKSNFGHAQAAAGVGGIIKMVMALRHEVMPRTLHVDEPSPHVDWSAGEVQLLTEEREWPVNGHPRRAGVSSFGISGTNAHVIIEEAPVDPYQTATAPIDVPKLPVPVVISARSAAALAAQAAKLQALLSDSADLRPVDLGISAAARPAHAHRAVVVGTGIDELIDGLTAVAEDRTHGAVLRGQARTSGGLGFLFTGQGSQRIGMGRELYQGYPAFAAAFDAVVAELDSHLDRPLREVVWGADQELLNQTGFAQPALFALEVALYRLFESWGVRPDYVAGHSIGELSAAHVAGVLTLSDAARLVVARGRLMQALPTGGAMVAIAATEDEVAPLLTDSVSIAALNAPGSVVVSGVEEAVLALAESFAVQGRKTNRLRVSHAFHSLLMEPMLAEFAEIADQVTFAAPSIPMVSTVTGAPADEQIQTPEYWVNQVRATVRFADAARTLSAAGVTRFVEIGPDAALTPMTVQCLDTAEATVVATLRKDRDEPTGVVTALAHLSALGVTVDWPAFYRDSGATRIDLPTYAFQREYFWLLDEAAAADAAAMGLDSIDHPLLGAVVATPEHDTVVLTGRLSLHAQPWLADHRVFDTILVPGTALVELVIQAGDQVGYQAVEELILRAPLVVPAERGRRLRITVGAADNGRRAVVVLSRAEAGDDWLVHAEGTLTESALDTEPLLDWPPTGAQPIPLDDAYARLAEQGYHYGPTFQGLHAAWQHGDSIFAEVLLPQQAHADAARFALHPALLDAALHALRFGDTGDDRTLLPFSWSGISLAALGATALRVAAVPSGPNAVALTIADAQGAPVATVRALNSRPVTPEQLGAPAEQRDSGLYGVEWQTLPERPAAPVSHAQWPIPDSDPIPDIVVLHTTPGTDAESVRAEAQHTLAVLQSWSVDERFTATRLLVVTRGAVAPEPGHAVTDLAGAGVWGLIRAAQQEFPDRVLVADVDGDLDVERVVAAEEPQLAVRAGTFHVPRLVRAAIEDETASPATSFAPGGTVLITGGTGMLGRLIARHLVTAHGVRHLILTSRSAEPDRYADLIAELTDAGARVTVAAADAADRAAMTELLAAIPPEHPLTGVLHLAGVLDDGIITALTPERLERVMRPKVDAALTLHELTEQLNLSAFVLFTSAAGVIGGAGQGNYAAANAVLDALVGYRRARGLTAQSLAWGLWADTAGMAGDLGDSDRARMSRNGVQPMTAEHGLALFDTAAASGAGTLVPIRLDTAALAQAGAALPPLLRALVRIPLRRTASGAAAATLRDRLSALPGDRRVSTILDLVRTQAAQVLGHRGTDLIEPDRAFGELGFDSLSAVEFRNALAAETGLRLPASLIFDYPSARAVAAHVVDEVFGAAPETVLTSGAIPVDEPMAIVGMACRYPGGVRAPEELWQLVADGVDAISAFPDNRGWDLEQIYDPASARPFTSYVNAGGFLHEAAGFDPGFFGISPNEALLMDPQQRLLLETTWEALERSGIDPVSLRGSQTGVFAGMMYHDYEANANTGSIASGRISYVFGLEGPAVTVDTACSSSLVALHLAGQALRSGECSLALVSGVAVMASPDAFIEFSRQQGLSRDGRCRSFAASAAGTAWAEGCGVLVLERLSDAERNGHPILAVVRGSAINQDGASNGLTAPNGPSQERVIRKALANAGLSTTDVDVVEAHGTGTTLGDPIEAQALLATYGRDRAADQPLWLGSLKSNIGHAQAAAGVAGVIKMVMAMRHGVLPRTLHVDEPSPKVDWTAGAVRLLTEAQDWPVNGHPRRAGVSAFGISGTNAHVIIEEPPVSDRGESTATEPNTLVPLLVSARSAQALPAQAQRLLDLLDTGTQVRAIDLGYSAATSRAAHAHRAVVLGADRAELIAGLSAVAQERPTANVVTGIARGSGRVGALFTGQGSQRLGMGKQLHACFPAFATAFDAVVAELDSHLDRSLREIVWGEDEDLLNQTGFAQPALFALEVALYRLFESWGVRPDYVAGHSIGELSAAHVAGVLTLSDAARLVVARGRLMQALPTGGAMVAIAATEDEVAPLLTDLVSIAALNAPGSVVVSGSEDAVLALAESFAVQGRKTTRLRVSHAFHSLLMEPMLAEFAEITNQVTFTAPSIPIVSTVTGSLDAEVTTPDYWVNQVRATVRFADAARTLSAAGVTRFVEIGPDAVLTAMAAQSVDADSAAFVSGSRKDRDEARTALGAVANLHTLGVAIDWPVLFAGTDATRIDLPTYAFQREHFWLLPEQPDADAAAMGLDTVDHPLFGAVVPAPDSGGVVFTGRLSARTHPWLADHRVGDTILLPGTGFVELAVEAGRRTGCAVLSELTLAAPLVLPEHGTAGIQIQVVVGGPDATAGRTVSIYSRAEGGDAGLPWLLHAEGALSSAIVLPVAADTVWPPADSEQIDLTGNYAELAANGYGYGPAFQGLRRAWRNGAEVSVEVELPEAIRSDATAYGLHPALLDACLHGLRYAAPESEEEEQRMLLPFSWHGVAVHAAGADAVRARLTWRSDTEVALTLTDTTGAAVASVESLVLREVSPEQLSSAGAGPVDSLYQLAWVPVGGIAADGVTPTVTWDRLDATTSPEVVVLEPVPGMDAAAVHSATHAVLAVLHQWSTESRFADTTLVVRTRGAVAPPGTDITDLAGAAVWGLVRSAQSEQLGRIVLLDTDGSVDLSAVLATGEPQILVRDNALHVGRLTRVPAGGEPPAAEFADTGVVLVTGATGTLGGVIARHLVARHGVRRLLLTSRRGATAPGAEELRDELTALGADVEFAACDTADRAALAALLDGVDLAGVVHVAGVLDDGVIAALTPQRLDTVLTAKVDAALNLHELTRDRNLSAFVLFSSAAGVFGNPGQGNYAAANAFLDALAQHRRAHGLPAQAQAWGLWEDESGMGGTLSDGDRQRLQRTGVLPLTRDFGLALFDAATTTNATAPVAIRFDLNALTTSEDEPPALLRGLVRRTARRGRTDTAAAETLRRRLAEVTEPDRSALLLDLVCTHAALVLGHSGAHAIEPDRAFSELGFDSLAAVEFRNEVNRATGLRLPPTLIFDYPNATVLTAKLQAELAPNTNGHTESGTDPERIRRILGTVSLDRLRAAGLLDALLELGASPDEPSDIDEPAVSAEVIDDMDADSLIAMAFAGLDAGDASNEREGFDE
ncbi:type I polyketide synthase [Nocardia sp. NPDC051030]|uniref:type I polyketide synthase n=1 Tax=Nocardia sp. NPDC051030 TaxID=3155162 RepID=UPI00344003DE